MNMSVLICRCGHDLDSHIEEEDNSYCTGEHDGTRGTTVSLGCMCHQFASINDTTEDNL